MADQMEYERMHRFKELSMMHINGQPVSKLDYVAHISIHGSGYFNVFRRYNSRYEFLVEDLNGDIHFHKDVTIRESLQAILCLTDEQMVTAVIVYATGFKMQTPISLSIHTHWSELHREHHGAMITVHGILEDYPHAATTLSTSFPSMMETPIAAATTAVAATTTVLAPVKAPGEIELCESCIESVKQNLFEEFAKTRQLKRKYDDISMVKEEDSESDVKEEEEEESDLDDVESNSEEEQDESDLENKVYMTLRSRTIQQ